MPSSGRNDAVAREEDGGQEKLRPPSETMRSEPVLAPQRLVLWVSSLLIAASMMMVVWNLQDSSLTNANTGSRYATIESLVDHGTYYIDASQYLRTPDKVKVGEHFLSSKPPVLPTYGAAVYWAYQAATGQTIAEHEGNVVRLVSLLTGGLFHLIFLIYFYRLSRLLLVRPVAQLSVMAAACFSYLGVAYATAINNHSVGASLLVVAFYYAFVARNDPRASRWTWTLAGLVLGLLVAVDLPSGIFVPLLGGYLFTHDRRRTVLYFVPALLPGIGSQLGLSWFTTGSIEPAYFNKELKNFAGNYFRGHQRGIDALREPKHIYAFNVLIGHHGLFSMTPLLGFGLYELVRSLAGRARRAEAWVLATGALIVLGFYVFRTRNYGGWCVGMRHLVPLMPLLLLYFGLWLDRVRITRWVLGVVLLAFSVGAFHVQDGLSSPFQFSLWHNWLEGKPNRNRIGPKLNLGRAYEREAKALRKQRARQKAQRRRQDQQRRQQVQQSQGAELGIEAR